LIFIYSRASRLWISTFYSKHFLHTKVLMNDRNIPIVYQDTLETDTLYVGYFFLLSSVLWCHRKSIYYASPKNCNHQDVKLEWKLRRFGGKEALLKQIIICCIFCFSFSFIKPIHPAWIILLSISIQGNYFNNHACPLNMNCMLLFLPAISWHNIQKLTNIHNIPPEYNYEISCPKC